MRRFLILAAVAALGSGGVVSADEVTFLYDFSTGNRDGSIATSSNLDPLFSATDYISGFAGGLTADSGLSGGKAFAKTSVMPDFQSFTLESLGTIESLDRLTFDLDVSGFASQVNNGRWVQVDALASIDGFVADSTNLGSIRLTKVGGFSEPATQLADFDLSGFSQFQDLANTNVEFRLQFSAERSVAAQRGIVDNVALTFSSVPEPGSAVVIAVCGIAGFCRRKR